MPKLRTKVCSGNPSHLPGNAIPPHAFAAEMPSNRTQTKSGSPSTCDQFCTATANPPGL
jgi:hypothetical protein